MEAISVVVRIQSPRHFSWPLIITPDLWGWILWIFLIKFKFKEGISLFLCEILEFDMTTDSWIINRELRIKLGGQKEIHKTQGINYVQHLTRILPKNSSPFLAESALPHKHSPLHRHHHLASIPLPQPSHPQSLPLTKTCRSQPLTHTVNSSSPEMVISYPFLHSKLHS
jgi:hypothetical protein